MRPHTTAAAEFSFVMNYVIIIASDFLWKKYLEIPVGLTSLIVALCVFHFYAETYQLRFLYADVHDLYCPENMSVCLHYVQWTLAWELPITL